MKEDINVLRELLDTVWQLKQRSGLLPESERSSSVRKLESELQEFEVDVDSGKLNGRAQRRKANELFFRIIRLHPEDFGQ